MEAHCCRGPLFLLLVSTAVYGALSSLNTHPSYSDEPLNLYWMTTQWTTSRGYPPFIFSLSCTGSNSKTLCFSLNVCKIYLTISTLTPTYHFPPHVQGLLPLPNLNIIFAGTLQHVTSILTGLHDYGTHYHQLIFLSHISQLSIKSPASCGIILLLLLLLLIRFYSNSICIKMSKWK